MTISKNGQSSAAALAGHDGFSLITNEKLLQIYTAMVKCRLLEKRVRRLFPRNNFFAQGKAAAALEAVHIGVAIDLQPGDAVMPDEGSFIVPLIQGKPLDKIVASLFERAAKAELAVRLDTDLDRAMGRALTNKTKGNGKIVVAFCHDTKDSSELWKEAIETAGAHHLPILFVRPASLPAAGGSPRSKSAKLARQTAADGSPSIPVDGQDVVAVYRVATEAATQARKGNGATLIECSFAASEGQDSIDKHDPIAKMESYLAGKGLFGAGLRQEITADFTKTLEAAIKAASGSRSF